TKTEFLRDRRQNQRSFHQREGISDALSRAAAEWEICKTRQPFRQIVFPSFRKEFLGLVKPARIAMHNPLRERDACSRRKFVSRDFHLLFDKPRNSPSGRIQPHGLGQDVAGVNKSRNVINGRSSAAEYGVEFCEEFFLGFGILREQPKRPRKRVRRRFVSREKKGDGFIAQLLVGHARTVFVLHREEHGK